MDFAWLVAEDKIKTALKNGDFDDLPGKGKRQNLEDLSMIPEDLRIVYKVLKNSGYLSEEVDLKNELLSLEKLLEYCEDDREKERLKQLRYIKLYLERRFRLTKEYQPKVQKKLTEW
ncbi:J-domain-containing protein [Guptibacillus hwajinpoensis]|uniref:DnaJ family domain-containing protein n=1 Tax=Guptibacillus hwajinpoensis TaxID=208199 RepID=UPI001CFEB63C|nr:DnaJ family domain-containing protein [Pseudalkalibacillus hwajinpoensis]WLR58348.1 DUF1992 domain-containing protein [Pseudalkalibacillus hwajinpoensis]